VTVARGAGAPAFLLTPTTCPLHPYHSRDAQPALPRWPRRPSPVHQWSGAKRLQKASHPFLRLRCRTSSCRGRVGDDMIRVRRGSGRPKVGDLRTTALCYLEIALFSRPRTPPQLSLVTGEYGGRPSPRCTVGEAQSGCRQHASVSPVTLPRIKLLLSCRGGVTSSKAWRRRQVGIVQCLCGELSFEEPAASVQ
jgi:hypothetical protein